MARPDERRFVTFERGHIRDNIILSRFRIVLRERINPDTGQPFTEDEIALVTQPDSRFYIEADAIDLFGQAIQQRAIWFADQVRPDRAASPGWLDSYHGDLWLPDGKLPASGGSGPVRATGSTGTIWVGSTTIGDPSAAVARDPAGNRYQVLVTAVAPGSGQVDVQLAGIDTGDATNPEADTVLTWVNPPLGSDPQANTLEDFSGGFNEETAAEFALRIIDRIRHKPGAGNSPQMRAWGLAASVAVESAFIYPSALHAGSTLVAIVQKRGQSTGPLGRFPSFGTLTAVTAYLVPPSSPVVPTDQHVLVTTINSEPSDIVLRLAMRRASAGGWLDAQPWPKWTAGYPDGVKITNVGSQTVIKIETDSPLAGTPLSGVDAPKLMVWDDDLSRFEVLDVDEVDSLGGSDYQVTLNNPPAKTLVIGDLISPVNGLRDTIAETFEDYFDELGPGQVVADDDLRFVRAARFPRTDERYPIRAGQGIIARLDDVLGGAIADAALEDITQSTPTLPTDITLGPNMLTLGRAAIYPFD